MNDADFQSMESLLEGHFDESLDGRSHALIERVTEAFYPHHWDGLTPSSRRSLARQADAQDDPSTQKERDYFWQWAVQISEAELAINEWELMRAQNIAEKQDKTKSLAELRDRLNKLQALGHQPAFHITDWATLAEQQSPRPQSPPVAVASGSDAAWKEKARERAYEIIKQDRERSLYPSQLNLADQIAKEFRRDGVMGADGKPITGGYIKRHALMGISSAQGKQLSTSVGRGK